LEKQKVMAYTKSEKERIFDLICDRISKGMSLNNALAQEDTFSKRVWREMLHDDAKSTQYAHALIERAEVKFDSIERDYLEEPQRDPETGKIDSAWVQLQRLKIDAKKWELSKLMPKKYGDKLDIDHSNKGEAFKINPVQFIKTE